MPGALETMPNIGAVTAASLRAVGIATPEELRAAGSQKAFLLLRTRDSGACLLLLQGLEGAVRGIPKKELPPQAKAELKAFFHSLE